MKNNLRKIVSILISLALVLGLCGLPVYADDVIEFIPYDENGAYAVFDMYADVRCSAAQSQEILAFLNQIRKEACDQGIYFSWTNKYLTSADYSPLTWNSAIERYALTRAVDINFSFSHGYHAVCGAVAGASQNFYSENICWMGYSVSPMDLVKIYYDEKGVYLDAYNRGVAAGLSGASLTAFINSNASGPIGHYMSLINPGFLSVGSATIFRNATRNVLLLSYSPGDGAYYDVSGTQCLRIPVYAGCLGSCFGFNYPREIDCGSSASASFYLFGNTGNDKLVGVNNIQLVADNPDIVSASAEGNSQVFTANRGGSAGFRFTAGGNTIGDPFAINVKVPVASVSLASPPASSVYLQGAGYSLDGATVKVNYTDGRSDILQVTPSMVISEAKSAGKYNVTVSCLGSPLVVSFDDKTPDHPVSLSVQAPATVSYYIGDALDLTGGKAIIQNYSGNTTEYYLTDPAVTVGAFDSSYAGPKQVYVSVAGFSGSFTVNVSNPPYIAWVELQSPVKTQYGVGDDLDLTGCVMVLVYSDGSRVPVQVNTSMVSGYNKNATGIQNIFVSYSGFVNSFVVTVQENAPQASGDAHQTDVQTNFESSFGGGSVNGQTQNAADPGSAYAASIVPQSPAASAADALSTTAQKKAYASAVSVFRAGRSWTVVHFCKMLRLQGLIRMIIQKSEW